MTCKIIKGSVKIRILYHLALSNRLCRLTIPKFSDNMTVLETIKKTHETCRFSEYLSHLTDATMNSLMTELHAVRGEDGGGGRRVGGQFDGVEADCVVVVEVRRRRGGEVDDGAADDDGAQEQNH